MMLISKYGERDMFLKTYNPERQLSLCENTEDCYFGDYPTLSELKAGYGNNTPVAWLIPQLYNLSEYCGCRDKLKGVPLEECASIIAHYFYYLKVSEIMLFFYRFKSGLYGKFYGAVDPLTITSALRTFVRDRSLAYDKHIQEEKKREMDEWRKNAINIDEYNKIKQQ